MRSRIALSILMTGTLHFFASAQSTQWESMDGPYLEETRYHIRYVDGEQIFVGTQSGTQSSMDGGTTWQALAAPPAASLSVQVGANGELYAIGEIPVATKPGEGPVKGLFRSTNRGRSWIQLSSGVNLAIALGRGDTLFKMSGRGDIVSGATNISISTNKGDTWSSILQYTQLSGFDAMGLSRVYAHHGNVFALSQFSVFNDITGRSTDGGLTWQKFTGLEAVFNPPGNLLVLQRTFGGMGPLPYASMQFSNDNGTTWSTKLSADSGFASLTSNDSGTLLVLSKPGYAIWKSTDCGSSWSSLGPGSAGDTFESIRFVGKAKLLGRTRSGIWKRSVNFGQSWEIVTDPSGSPLTVSIQPIIDTTLFVADNRGGWTESRDLGKTWFAKASPYNRQQISSILVLPSGTLFSGSNTTLNRRQPGSSWSGLNVPGPVWGLSSDGNRKIYVGTGRYQSGGLGWNGYFLRIDTSGAPISFLAGGNTSYWTSSPDFLTTLAISPNQIVVGSGTRLGVSSDSGKTLDYRITGPGTFSALSQGDSGFLFAANLGGGVYRSTNSGSSWFQVNAGLTNPTVYSLARDSVNHIYAGAARGVFRSSNNGVSWTEISNGLPAATVQALTVSPGGYVYAGTPAGVYVNRGTLWERWSDGLTVQDVPALAIDRNRNVLAGTWGAGMYSRPESTVPSPMHFTTVASSPILSDLSNARATVWGDYDNDGDPDLFVANGGGVNNQLYRYDGWPTGFTKVSVGTIVNDGGDSRDAAWGDYDNDGYIDLLVVNFDGPPFLYHNNGNGSFTKTTSGPIATDAGSATSAAWADYDNDGRLDLFITRTGGQTNSLFRNIGNGSFSKVVTGEPATAVGNSEGCAWGDYDNDGYADLFVANAKQPGFLYHNNGNGTFTSIFTTPTTSVSGEARSCGWIDVNNDGRLDLWVSNGNREPLLLYLNDGNNQFTEILHNYIWTDATASRPLAWGDFDNDGDVDLFIAGRKTRSVIYLNDGTGQFTRVVTGMPMLGQELDGPASWADYSGDGNLDLLIANTAGPRELYWSDGNGRSALRVRCAGTLSDSRGVGSRVAIKATIAGNTSWYYRTSSGRDDLSMHFGLGDATAVDSLVVRWPITGMQILAPVSIDANLTITEPSTRSVPILLYPAHRSPDIPTTTMLRWRSSAGAMMYHLQVSTDTHFSSFEYNDSTLIDTTKILGPFALSTNYYWRVRAKDSFQSTPWTETWQFTTVMPVPDPPVLLSPLHNGSRQWITGSLSWRQNSRATRYHLQMAEDSLYTVLLLNDSTLADTNRTYAGTFASRYHWRVRAINGSGSSAFSSSWAFTTVLPPPGAPTLKAPLTSSDITAQTAMLTWFRPARAEQYQLQVAYDSLFTTRFLNDSALADTFRVLPVAPGKTYHWRVRTSGEGGFGPYSTIWNFKSGLASPTLVLPVNNALDLPLSLTLIWHPVAGAGTYRLLVGTDSAFSGPLVLDDSTCVDTTVVLPMLTEHVQYYWCVRAQAENATGAYSPIRHFRTALGIPALARPADKAVNQSVALALVWHPVASASAYQLQIGTTVSFDSGLVMSDSTIADTTKTISGLANNTLYYWRVKGITTTGSGAFSPAWWFRTIQVLPFKPELTHPLNSVALTTNVVAFVWKRSTPDVTRYSHELATDSAFFIKTTDSTITDTTYLKTGLPNGTYWWRVRANNSAGWGVLSDVRKFSVTVTGIDDPNDIPTIYSLDQNYPNPFNPTTIIRFGLPAASEVQLIVYNTLGQEIRTLFNQPMDPGYHTLPFNGAGLPSGVYFYRLRAGTFVETKRLLLIK